MPNDTNLLVGGFNSVKDSWKKDHDELKGCWAIEDKLRVGMGMFHAIQMADIAWSKDVQSGKANFDQATVRSLHNLYQWWLSPCEQILASVAKLEKTYKVDGAEGFRDCVRFASKRAAVDIERLVKTVEQERRGEAVELTEEQWDELVAEDDASRAA